MGMGVSLSRSFRGYRNLQYDYDNDNDNDNDNDVEGPDGTLAERIPTR
jgi:hypothetical protein